MKNIFELHLYHTSDTHGHLTSDSYTKQNPLPKGLARVSSFFSTQKYEHQLKIDLGDTIQGSPLTYIYKEEKNKQNNPFAETLNIIGYDYFVPGNHDFNYGLDYLNQMILALDMKTLCANVFKDKDLYFKYAYDIKKYQDGPKVAIIGITNNYVPNWESEENIKGLMFQNAFESAKQVIHELKEIENPDLIIVAYHGGYECNIETGINEAKNSDENLGCKIFTELKDIDILLTGHEHRLITLKKDMRIVHQVGYAASHLSHTKIKFTKEDCWKVDQMDGELISMEDYEDDPIIINHLENFLQEAKRKMDQVIGSTKVDLKIKDPFLDRLYKHPIFQYINEVQMKLTGAMISCCGLGNDVTGFNQQITLGDVLNTYVFPNTLYLVEINGKDLKEALKHQAKFFALDDNGEIVINPSYLYPKKELYNYDIFDGISYDLIINKDKENDCENITYQGHLIKDDEKFTLVLNSYRMSGGGNITWHKALKIIKAFPLDITEVLINDIKDQKEITIDYKDNIRVTKK